MDQGSDNDMCVVGPHSLVTERHVRAALESHKGKEAILKSWFVDDFTNTGDNYACVVSSVKVKFSIDGKESDEIYIVKLNPCRDMVSMNWVFHDLFVKEYAFYSTLAPELNSLLESNGCTRLKTADFYSGCLDEHHEIIFLEDLRRKGFKMFDRKKGMDVHHLKLVFEELGKFHAASVLLQAKYKSPSDFLLQHSHLETNVFSFSKTGVNPLAKKIEKSVSNCISLLESVAGYEKVISWIESLTAKLGDIFGKSKMSSKCNVICHGDLWNNNMLFRYNNSGHPVDVMLLDFQISRYASPATDLNYLLYTSVEGHIRRPNLNALLSLYYDSFKKTLSAGSMDLPFTLEELEEEFRMQNRFGAIIAMVITPLVVLETDDAPELANKTGVKDFRKGSRITFDNIVNKSEIVKSRFVDMFDEFIETGVIDLKC